MEVLYPKQLRLINHKSWIDWLLNWQFVLSGSLPFKNVFVVQLFVPLTIKRHSSCLFRAIAYWFCFAGAACQRGSTCVGVFRFCCKQLKSSFGLNSFQVQSLNARILERFSRNQKRLSSLIVVRSALQRSALLPARLSVSECTRARAVTLICLIYAWKTFGARSDGEKDCCILFPLSNSTLWFMSS